MKLVDKLSTVLNSLYIQIWFSYKAFSEMSDVPNNKSLNYSLIVKVPIVSREKNPTCIYKGSFQSLR